MPVKIIRRDLSALGFSFVLFLIVTTLITELVIGGVALLATLGPRLGLSREVVSALSSHKDSVLFLLTLNAVAQYLIAMPLASYLIHRSLPGPETRLAAASWAAIPRERDAMFRAQAGERPLGVGDIPGILAITVFFMFFGNEISLALTRLLGDVADVELTNRQVELMLSGNLWVTILFVVLLAPTVEELFFRKLLIDRVSPLGRRGAVLVSAVSFALVHQNLYQFFYALFLGLLLAMIYQKTGRVLCTVALHVGINFFGGVVLPYFTGPLEGIDPMGENAFWEVMRHPGAVLFILGYYALAVAGLICLLRWARQGRFILVERREAAPLGAFVRGWCTAPGQIVFAVLCISASMITLLMPKILLTK